MKAEPLRLSAWLEGSWLHRSETFFQSGSAKDGLSSPYRFYNLCIQEVAGTSWEFSAVYFLSLDSLPLELPESQGASSWNVVMERK